MNKYREQFRVPSEEKSRGVYGSSSSFRLHWDINTYCDKDCFYCYARAQLIWNKMSTKTTLDNIIQQLSEIKKPLDVVLLGGEPSLHPLYFYVLDQLELLDNLQSSAVLSNGGRKVTPEWIDKHVGYKNFWFNYTFHASETDDIHSGFLDKVIYTRDMTDNIIVNVMMIGPKWDTQIDEVVRTCSEHDVTIRANVLFKPKTCDGYMIESDSYRAWISGYADRFDRYLYFSEKVLERNKIDTQSVSSADGTFNDIEIYLNGLNKFKGWKCLNNNYAVEGSNNTEITRMCDNSQTGEYMVCPLERCVCQGLLTNEKYI
jgi:organic radical activating enzyme